MFLAPSFLKFFFWGGYFLFFFKGEGKKGGGMGVCVFVCVCVLAGEEKPFLFFLFHSRAGLSR